MKIDCEASEKSENLENTAEFAEIENLETEMRSETETFLKQQGIVFNDLKINYDKVAKIYIDMDISEITSMKETDIKNFLDEQDYVWVIPVEGITDTSEGYVKVTVARGAPLREEIAHLLTEEGKQRIKEQEGKWKISEIALVTQEVYTSQLDKKEDLIDGYSIVGGVRGMHHPIAIGYKDGEAKYWISLGFSYEALESRALYVSYSLKSDAKIQEDGVYDYQMVKDILDEWPTGASNISGGGAATFVYGKIGLYMFVVECVIIALLIYVGEKEAKKYRS